jgi:outer membrane protein
MCFVMGLNNSKMWGIALVTVLAAAGVATPAMADVKIAVVDYGRLLSESPQAKAALDAIRTEFGPKEREMQQQQAALKAKEDKLQKDGATMTPDQRSRAEKELRDGARDLQRKQQEAQDDLTARRNEEMSRLQKSLIEEVRTYAKAQNFDLVIADGVIYSVPALDITPAILASLQSRAPKPAAGSPAGGSAPKPPAK